MAKIVNIFKYREFCVHGAKFPIEHPFIQELRALVPRDMQDNHQVVLFDLGEDRWRQDCIIAVWFHDFDAYVGDPSQMRSGDVRYPTTTEFVEDK